jgi:hypothetical protein
MGEKTWPRNNDPLLHYLASSKLLVFPKLTLLDEANITFTQRRGIDMTTFLLRIKSEDRHFPCQNITLKSGHDRFFPNVSKASESSSYPKLYNTTSRQTSLSEGKAIAVAGHTGQYVCIL